MEIKIIKKVKIKLLNENAKAPTYGTDRAACFDFYSAEDAQWKEVHVRDVVSGVGKQVAWQIILPTGIAFEIPEDFRMDIYPRSGWGFKMNAQLANGTGKIDEDFRGEVKIKLIAFCQKEELPGKLNELGHVILEKQSRVGQGELNEVIRTEFKVVEELSDTNRGEDGFGSTGHK